MPFLLTWVIFRAVIYLIMFGFSVKPLYQRHQAWPRPTLSMDRQAGPQRLKVKVSVRTLLFLVT